MVYEKIVPIIKRYPTEYLGDKIRVGFPITQDRRVMLMYIGKDVAKKFNLNKKDRVILYIDTEEPTSWKLEKSEIEGFRLGASHNQLKLQITWHRPIPKGMTEKLRFVKYDKEDGHIKLELSKGLN